MTEERGRAAAPEGARPHGAPPDGSPRCHPPGPPRGDTGTWGRGDTGTWGGHGGDTGGHHPTALESPGGVRWSPLSGAQLEEMVREATRLAAQLQHSHLPPLGPGPSPPGGGGSPRNPRRETFVVKDSPVRELLPTVPPAREVGDGAAGGGHHVRGHEGARGQRPPGHQRTPRGWGLSGVPPPTPPSLPGQPKARGGAAAAPPTRAPRARATTAAVPVPSSRPPPPSAIPKPPPGRAGTLGTAPGGRAPPRASVVAPRGKAGSCPRGHGDGPSAPPMMRGRPVPQFPHACSPPRCRGGPWGGWFRVQSSPPQQPPAPPPEDDGQQHPAVMELGRPGKLRHGGAGGSSAPPQLPPKGGGRGSGWILL
uniref:Uncharacterized protein n=1 Tax=Anas platyrhynchos TaxID=8839 RepID=A0A8B9TQ35_ANAPL